MFAVPGWSVSSSSLKTQIKASAKEPPVNSNSADRHDEDPRLRNSKKRKRNRGRSDNANLSTDNLLDLWEKITQGKPTNPTSGQAAKASKLEKKRLRNDRNGHTQNLVPKDIRSKSPKGDVQIPQPNENLLKAKYQRCGNRETSIVPDSPGHPKPTQSARPTEPLQSTNLTQLQISMQQKLTSARFRHLNQILYTTPSSSTLQLFHQNPEMFDNYHQGFRRQVEVWPENPVDGYIRTLKERGKKRKGNRIRDAKGQTRDLILSEGNRNRESAELPRTEGVCTVADLGCGDAKLAQAMEDVKKKLKINVLSYDLHSSSRFVTRSDIAQLPLGDESVDVAIFCLALMGTNWIDFVEESWRVLRWRGELWVAEIKSRFGRVDRRGARGIGSKGVLTNQTMTQDADCGDHSAATEMDSGRHETDVSALVNVFRNRGFALQNGTAVDMSNKMFVKLNFVKSLVPLKGKGIPSQKGVADRETRKKRKFLVNDLVEDDESGALKPCVYKIR
ncbi:MAG: 25S rRNA (adenine645-N1)-methyltransferase [Geoglossum umbratile]|nr:MAG: 25S rRNA (adenine645-N1)-methyltransferase [Geoglossum umbratile]